MPVIKPIQNAAMKAAQALNKVKFKPKMPRPVGVPPQTRPNRKPNNPFSKNNLEKIRGSAERTWDRSLGQNARAARKLVMRNKRRTAATLAVGYHLKKSKEIKEKRKIDNRVSAAMAQNQQRAFVGGNTMNNKKIRPRVQGILDSASLDSKRFSRMANRTKPKQQKRLEQGRVLTQRPGYRPKIKINRVVPPNNAAGTPRTPGATPRATPRATPTATPRPKFNMKINPLVGAAVVGAGALTLASKAKSKRDRANARRSYASNEFFAEVADRAFAASNNRKGGKYYLTGAGTKRRWRKRPELLSTGKKAKRGKRFKATVDKGNFAHGKVKSSRAATTATNPTKFLDNLKENAERASKRDSASFDNLSKGFKEQSKAVSESAPDITKTARNMKMIGAAGGAATLLGAGLTYRAYKKAKNRNRRSYASDFEESVMDRAYASPSTSKKNHLVLSGQGKNRRWRLRARTQAKAMTPKEVKEAKEKRDRGEYASAGMILGGYGASQHVETVRKNNERKLGDYLTKKVVQMQKQASQEEADAFAGKARKVAVIRERPHINALMDDNAKNIPKKPGGTAKFARSARNAKKAAKLLFKHKGKIDPHLVDDDAVLNLLKSGYLNKNFATGRQVGATLLGATLGGAAAYGATKYSQSRRKRR